MFFPNKFRNIAQTIYVTKHSGLLVIVMRLCCTSEENATSSQFEILLDFLVMEQTFSLAQEIIPDIADCCWNMFERCRVLGCEMFATVALSPPHLLGRSFLIFEIVFLMQSILEMVVIINRDYLACPPYVILASVDYSILLLCHSIATW